MQIIYSLLAGAIFGAGLTVSDLVNPARILNFLDVAGNWDPTLLFVMAGGLTVAAVGYSFVFRRSVCVVGDKFNLPSQQRVDVSLVGGAAVFGVGWGLAGICPGPALTDLVMLDPKILLFVAAMLVGMIGANSWPARAAVTKALPDHT